MFFNQNIFKMVDANHDGIIDAENELNLHKHRTPEYATYAREQTEILLNDQNHAWVFSIFSTISFKIRQNLGTVGFAQISVKDAKAIVWRYFLHVLIDLVFDIFSNFEAV